MRRVYSQRLKSSVQNSFYQFTPEEGWRTQQSRCDNNKDEDNRWNINSVIITLHPENQTKFSTEINNFFSLFTNLLRILQKMYKSKVCDRNQ